MKLHELVVDVVSGSSHPDFWQVGLQLLVGKRTALQPAMQAESRLAGIWQTQLQLQRLRDTRFGYGSI